MASISPITGKSVPLSQKQEAFSRAYVANGGNAAAAARTAGYGGENHSVVGCSLLKNERVNLYIAALTAEALANGSNKEIPTPEATMKAIWHEARYAKSDQARATNLRALAQFHGLLLERRRDETALENRSEEDLLELVRNLRKETEKEGIVIDFPKKGESA